MKGVQVDAGRGEVVEDAGGNGLLKLLGWQDFGTLAAELAAARSPPLGGRREKLQLGLADARMEDPTIAVLPLDAARRQARQVAYFGDRYFRMPRRSLEDAVDAALTDRLAIGQHVEVPVEAARGAHVVEVDLAMERIVMSGSDITLGNSVEC